MEIRFTFLLKTWGGEIQVGYYLGRCVATRTHEFLALKDIHIRASSVKIVIALHKIPAAFLHNMRSWPYHYYYYKMRRHWNIYANVCRHSQRNRIRLKLEQFCNFFGTF